MNTVKPTWTKADWFNVMLGIWVAISPLALGFVRRSAIWNNIVLGVVILMVALLSGWGDGAIAGLLVVLGLWLFTSPFVLGFWKPAFLWNNVVTPFVLITSAAISDELRVIQLLPHPRRSKS